jgi:hypothetical protein
MTIALRPDQEQLIADAIRAGVIRTADDVVEVGLEAVRTRLEERLGTPGARAAAVRRMREFGEEYQLSLGEPITRALLHEEHRY